MIGDLTDLIDSSRVFELHQRGLREHGGRDGVLDRNCPDAAIGAAANGAYFDADGRGAEVDPLNFAARLLVRLNKKHCFADGNKRVAFFAMVDVLLKFEIEIDATVEEAEEICDRVARRGAEAEEVMEWLAQPGRLVAAPPKGENAIYQ